MLLLQVFGVLSIALDLPPFSLFLFTVATTDVVTLNFFFLVRDHGSWLEIGTSISHFVIASAFEVLSVLLFGLSSLLVGGVYVAGPKHFFAAWNKQRTVKKVV
jgi:phosphatidylinositol glycan class N